MVMMIPQLMENHLAKSLELQLASTAQPSSRHIRRSAISSRALKCSRQRGIQRAAVKSALGVFREQQDFREHPRMRRVFGERPEVAAEGLAYKDTDNDVDASLVTPQVRVCAGLASIAVVSLLGIIYAVSSSSIGNHNQSSIADDKTVLDMLYTEVRKNSEVLKAQLHEAQDEKQAWKKRALHDLV